MTKSDLRAESSESGLGPGAVQSGVWAITQPPDVPGPLAEPARFGVYTGIACDLEGDDQIPPAARLGLEPPRFCGQCGRRMVVQVRPDGWDARCSRHGTVDSTELGER